MLNLTKYKFYIFVNLELSLFKKRKTKYDSKEYIKISKEKKNV